MLAAFALVPARKQAFEAKQGNDADQADRESLQTLNRVRWEIVQSVGGQLVLQQLGTETVHDVRAWTKVWSFNFAIFGNSAGNSFTPLSLDADTLPS